MIGKIDEKQIRKQDATTEGSSAALARQKGPAHFVDEISNISIAPNGAGRLHFLAWSTDDSGQSLRIDSELILTRTILNTLAEALPKALAQSDDSRTKHQENSTKRIVMSIDDARQSSWVVRLTVRPTLARKNPEATRQC